MKNVFSDLTLSTGLFYLFVASTGEGCLPPPPSKNLIKTTWSIETWRADSRCHVLQNMLIWKYSDKKWRHNGVLVSYTNLHKIRSRQSRHLKLGGQTPYIQLHQMWDFGISATWNDTMMTSSLCFLNPCVKRATDDLQQWNFAGW